MQTGKLHDVSHGEALHHSVRADRWCVTREDFSHLCRLILEAMEDGWLSPSETDPFDKGDATVACQPYVFATSTLC